MAGQIQLRQGTTTEHNSFTGAVGEVTVDTTKDTLVVHDGVTAGGHPVAARANADGTISLIKKDGTSAGTINADGLFNNTLTSTSTTQALTAAQGKVLKDTLDTTTSSTFGVGQEWIDLTSQRSVGVDYENNTGRTIFVSVVFGAPSLQGVVYHLILTTPSNQEVIVGLTSPIPHGYKYRLYLAGTIGINKWSELR